MPPFSWTYSALKVRKKFYVIWEGVSLDDFIGMLDSYLRWYRDKRLKSDLGYMNPRQYRERLGLAA